jgi:hypothetical protein
MRAQLDAAAAFKLKSLDQQLEHMAALAAKVGYRHLMSHVTCGICILPCWSGVCVAITTACMVLVLHRVLLVAVGLMTDLGLWFDGHPAGQSVWHASQHCWPCTACCLQDQELQEQAQALSNLQQELRAAQAQLNEPAAPATMEQQPSSTVSASGLPAASASCTGGVHEGEPSVAVHHQGRHISCC